MEFYLIMRRYARNSYGTILRFLQSKHNKHNKQQQHKKSMKRIIIKVMVIDMCVVLCFKIKYTQALGIHNKKGFKNRYKSQNSSPFFLPLTLLQFSYKNKMALFMCAVCVI